MIEIDRIDHLVLTVSSIENTCSFYCDILGMDRERFAGDRTALKFGRQKINLHQAGLEIMPNAKLLVPGSADLCLIAVSPISDVVSHLGACQVDVEIGPVKGTGANGPITSVYIRDPDENLVEISVYE